MNDFVTQLICTLHFYIFAQSSVTKRNHFHIQVWLKIGGRVIDPLLPEVYDKNYDLITEFVIDSFLVEWKQFFLLRPLELIR